MMPAGHLALSTRRGNRLRSPGRRWAEPEKKSPDKLQTVQEGRTERFPSSSQAFALREILGVKILQIGSHNKGQMEELACGCTTHHFRWLASSTQSFVKGLDEGIEASG